MPREHDASLFRMAPPKATRKPIAHYYYYYSYMCCSLALVLFTTKPTNGKNYKCILNAGNVRHFIFGIRYTI